MNGPPGAGWWDRGLDRGEAMLRTRGGVVAVGAVVSLVALLILPTGRGPEDADAAVTLLLMEIAVLAALLPSGMVSGELRRGIALLWIQRRGLTELHYLGRVAEVLLLTLLWGLAIMGLQGLLFSLVGGDAVRFLASSAPAIPAVVLLVGIPTFALSCSGVQGEGLGALALLGGWLAAPSLLPSDGLPGLVARVVEATSPPVEILQGLRGWGLGTDGPSPGEGAYFVVWVTAVSVLGMLVLSRRLRMPFASEQSR